MVEKYVLNFKVKIATKKFKGNNPRKFKGKNRMKIQTKNGEKNSKNKR